MLPYTERSCSSSADFSIRNFYHPSIRESTIKLHTKARPTEVYMKSRQFVIFPIAPEEDYKIE